LFAAIRYETGFPIDDFTVTVAEALRADGVRLHGVVQRNVDDTARSAMTLVDLATGEHSGISQDLGPHARGCRLDSRGLAASAAMLDAPIDDAVDLLILNKFGKAEAEGGGLRSAFARAIDAGIPVLTAVRPPYVEAWSEFHGGLATAIEPRLDMVLGWCRSVATRLRLRSTFGCSSAVSVLRQRCA
jgi:nucleoside-triphosphatase THEP1